MHKILVNTHKESNINILKARDYYFDKARFINNRLRKICLLGSIFISLIGIFSIPALRFLGQENLALWIEQNLDIVVGVIAILSFIIDFFLKKKVDAILLKSNALRELYDVKVLGIEENEFYFNYTEEEIKELLQTAQHVKDSDKYEVWYREIFSENDFANAICAMMDNIIYTYHVYTENMKQHFHKLIFVFVLFSAYCFNYFWGPDLFEVVNPFILFLAIFDYVKELVDSYFVSKDLVQTNKELKKTVMDKGFAHMSSKQDGKLVLRCIQDVVISNREKSLFISKSVRAKFLDNNCPYYKELDQVKNVFWGKHVTQPQCASDFEISSVEDENKLISLDLVHRELNEMLVDVKRVLDKHKLSFFLDGGTLIGACRKSNHNRFLQWDDDIDIAVKSSDVKRIMEVIADELGDKYEVQNYYNEEMYSPRLSTFRIRQKNEHSKVSEKDSELFELYDKRGLFLDVYAYTPILRFKWVDVLYRHLFIHTLNKKIRKVETNWKIGRNPDGELVQFKRLKRKYIRRASWYCKHAKNKKYVAYEPFYIHNLKKAGPYIKTEDMYGEKKVGEFEGRTYEIPSDSEAVLRAFYGEKWEESPFKTIEELIENDTVNYSSAKFDASCYKHLKRVSVYGGQEHGLFWTNSPMKIVLTNDILLL